MYRIHCRRANIDHELGAHRVISAHRTSEGVVTYLRCPCGDVVIVAPAPGQHRGEVAA